MLRALAAGFDDEPRPLLTVTAPRSLSANSGVWVRLSESNKSNWIQLLDCFFSAAFNSQASSKPEWGQ